MAQFATQAVTGGAQGVLAWMLDDTSYDGFTCGMWKAKKDGYALRPWFSVWGLLTRSFPAGSIFATVPAPAPGVEVLAARLPGVPERWAFCITNAGTVSVTFRLRVPGAPDAVLDRYVYADGPAKSDADGFPLPSDRAKVSPDAGWEVSCPEGGVVFLVPGDRP